MGLIGNIAKSYYKVEVVSDLPGRLRLKIRNFNKIPSDMVEKFFPAVNRVVSAMKGVLSAEANKRTGSLLITYDKKKTSCAKISSSIDKMIDVGIMLYQSDNTIGGKSAEEIEKAFLIMLGQNKE